jgi:glyoxylase-like metal-dependent hydrolase (beta-lactamase superfamily II)
LYRCNEIRRNIFSIEDNNVRMYLVCGSKCAVLLDTGYGGENLLTYVRQIYSGEVFVAHTHTHIDHIGGDAQFDKIYASPAEWDILVKSGISREHLRPLHNGDIINLGSKELTVYETPGHTKCSLCFADKKKRLIFTGDNISDDTVYLCMPGSDIELYEKSLRMLLDMQDDYDVYLGCHGRTEQHGTDIQNLLNCISAIKQGLAKEETFNPYDDFWARRYSYGVASVFLPLNK